MCYQRVVNKMQFHSEKKNHFTLDSHSNHKDLNAQSTDSFEAIIFMAFKMPQHVLHIGNNFLHLIHPFLFLLCCRKGLQYFQS